MTASTGAFGRTSMLRLVVAAVMMRLDRRGQGWSQWSKVELLHVQPRVVGTALFENALNGVDRTVDRPAFRLWERRNAIGLDEVWPVNIISSGEPLDPLPPQPYAKLREWVGEVVVVSESTFRCHLISDDDDAIEVVRVFSREDVPQEDRDLVAVGAEFRFLERTVGDGGRYFQLRFPRHAEGDPADVEAARQRGLSVGRRINELVSKRQA